MHTQISTKLAALGVALMINGSLIGSIAFLFNGQVHQAAASAIANVPALTQVARTV